MPPIFHEEVPDLSIVPALASTAPSPNVGAILTGFVNPATVAPTAPPPTFTPVAPPSVQAQPIPQPGRPLVEIGTGNAILAPTVPAPSVASTAPAPNVGAILTSIVNPPVAPTVSAPTAPLANAPLVAPEETGGNVSRQGEPIPQPGHPLVDTVPGVFIPAPETLPVAAEPPAQTPSGEDETGLPDLEGLDLFGNPPLSGAGFVQYVRRGCQERNLDDLAVFANAMAEGLGGGMGDNGTSFGPWNMHQGGKLPAKYSSYPAFSPLVQTWAWTASGIDWALNLMAKEGIPGLRGHAAVHRIVEYFEIPANIGGQEVIRDDYYDQLAKMGDPYSFLAARAAGPSVDITPVKTTGGATSKSPVGAVGFWRTLMDVFWKEVPKTRERVLAQGDSMKGVFK